MKLKSQLFNVFDVLILFLVLAVFLGLLFDNKNQELKMLFDKKADASVIIDLNNSDINAKSFKTGDKIYFSESGELLGTVTNSVNIKNKLYYPSANTIIYEYGSENIGVRLTLDSKIKTNATGRYVNGAEFITVGKTITVDTDEIREFEAVVYDIKS